MEDCKNVAFIIARFCNIPLRSRSITWRDRHLSKALLHCYSAHIAHGEHLLMQEGEGSIPSVGLIIVWYVCVHVALRFTRYVALCLCALCVRCVYERGTIHAINVPASVLCT